MFIAHYRLIRYKNTVPPRQPYLGGHPIEHNKIMMICNDPDVRLFLN